MHSCPGCHGTIAVRRTLAALRARLAANLPDAPLFDTDRTRRQVEAAYATAWRRRMAGLAPRSFDVPEDA